MLIRLATVVFLLAAAALPARALDIDVASFKLKNGMQVVVIPDARAPVVTHMVWYKVGAADDPPGKSGLAHFLEHLMFKGTPKYPQGDFSRIVRLNGGEENAFTSKDYTAYFQRVMKDRLPLVMEMEADRMQNLVLTDENTLPERSVVAEERRERIENEPSSLLAEQLDAALYTAHPYGRPVIGWMSEVAKLTRQDALDFYATHYQPANAILVVAGDVTADEVKLLAERHYEPLQNRRPVVDRERVVEPLAVAERRVTMQDERASTPNWQREYLTPAARNLKQRDELALSLLSDILGGGSQSRLYRKLVLDMKIAAYAGAWFNGDMLDHGGLAVYAAPNPGAGLPEIEAAVDAVVADILEKGVTQQELDQARDRVTASAVYLLDSQKPWPASSAPRSRPARPSRRS